MSKPKHWSEASDSEEMVHLMIREGYCKSLICQVTNKKADFVEMIAEKYELMIRPEPVRHDKTLFLKKHFNWK